MSKFLYKHRRGTTDDWELMGNEIVPQEGEIVVEIDEKNNLHKLKIGDGVHTYAELKYLMAGDEVVSQVLTRVSRLETVTLDVNSWVETACGTDVVTGAYNQVVELANITSRSRLDLQPDVDMVAEMGALGVSFVTENKGGILTVYSVGNKPTKTYVMQATVVETDVADGVEKVVGIPIATSSSTAGGGTVFIRYSANSDGSDFTESWSSGQRYIGIATGATPPSNKEAYTWALFVGGSGSSMSEYDGNGNVTLFGGYTATDDGAGNVVLS